MRMPHRQVRSLWLIGLVFVTTLWLLYLSYYAHLSYTESNCIRRVVGGYKMPINRAKHEYIWYYLYILYPTSCNGNTPVTLSPHQTALQSQIREKAHKNVCLAPPPPDSCIRESLVKEKEKNLEVIQILS